MSPTRRITRTPCFLEVEATCLETGRTRCIPQILYRLGGWQDGFPGKSVTPRGLVYPILDQKFVTTSESSHQAKKVKKTEHAENFWLIWRIPF